MNKRVFALTTAIILLVASGLYFFLKPGELGIAPDISLNIIDGRKINFTSLQGKPLLVTFWSTTCSKCMEEMPYLVELYKELNKEGFEIIGIAMSYDPPNRVVELSEKKSIPYPIALDIHGKISKAFGNVSVTPTSFLIDPRGVIIQQKTGTLNIKALRMKIKELLNPNLNTIS